MYLWLLLVTTYNRIRFSEDLWWGGFFIFWMHRAGAGDMTSNQDEIIKEMLSSFLLFIFVFLFSAMLWWEFMVDNLFSMFIVYEWSFISKIFFCQFFFVITYYMSCQRICSRKEHISKFVCLFLSSSFDASLYIRKCYKETGKKKV